MADPTSTDGDKYVAIFENEQVRVLEYRDQPGATTSPHSHPDSVMYALSGFRRRLIGESGDNVEVTIQSGDVRWLASQTHSGENIGETETHVIFVELKGPGAAASHGAALGPS